MDSNFNNDKNPHYNYSRNPNFRKQVENYEKNKMHSLAISVMNLISLFNSSSNENNNNISAMNVLSKIKSINDSEINKNEFNDDNNYGNYIEQIGGNIDKGRISQNMISNNNNYPGRSIIDKYNYYYKKIKDENALKETAFQNLNNNLDKDNNDIDNDNNIIDNKINRGIYKNDFNENFDDKNKINPLQGKLNNNYNNFNNNNSFNNNDNFSNNSNNDLNNNSSKQTIIQFNDYMIRSNNPGKYNQKDNI